MTNDWKNDLAKMLEEVTGNTVAMQSHIDFGRELQKETISVIVDGWDDEGIAISRDPRELLMEIREKLPETGFVAYIGNTSWLTEDAPDGVELCIGRGESQFDILRLAFGHFFEDGEQDGDSIETINSLMELEKDYPFDIQHAETDTITIDFAQPISDYHDLAERLMEICPDITQSEISTVEDLSAYLEEGGQVALWWD
jgi:acyl carrier protein